MLEHGKILLYIRVALTKMAILIKQYNSCRRREYTRIVLKEVDGVKK